MSILNADSSTYDFYFDELVDARVLIASKSEDQAYPSTGIWNASFPIEDPYLECRMQPVLNTNY